MGSQPMHVRKNNLLFIALFVFALLVLIHFLNKKSNSTIPPGGYGSDRNFEQAVDSVELHSSSVTIRPEIAPISHIYVSSAYYVTDTNSDGKSTNYVRMLALAEKDIEELSLFCKLDDRHKKPIWNQTVGSPACKFATYLVDCMADAKPTNFSLAGPGQIEHKLQITEPDSKPRKLVVCFSRMFLYERWQIALASLELYKLHGADLMVIPISSVVKNLHRILEAYAQEGNVRLKPAVQMPKFPGLSYDPNTETEWFQQVVSYSECLYDYRESADFILNIDFDDIILPKNFDSLHEELTGLSGFFPSAGSFEFLWLQTEAREFNSSEEFSISRLIKDSSLHGVANYGKSAIRPKRVNQAFIHRPSENELLAGFKHQTLTEKYTMAIHFRAFATNETLQAGGVDNYFSKRSIYSQIDRKFDDFIKQNETIKNAYSKLSDKYSYLFAMINCYKDIAKETSTLTYCPNPLRCAPKDHDDMPDCVVLEQNYRHTKMSDFLYLATPTFSKFDLHASCLT